MPLEIEALSAVRVAQRAFQRDGDAFFTLIVKATFMYGASGDAWLVEPEPLSLDVTESAFPEPLLRRAARTARATELAPNLRRGGVTVLGFARAPRGTMAREIGVRLAVVRGADALVDKRLYVVGDRQSADAFPDPFEAIPLADELCWGGPGDPVNPGGVGVGASAATLPNILPDDRSTRFANLAPWPTPRTSPIFIDLDQPFPDIRTEAEWEAFQTAPPDQRLLGMREFFTGDERIVLSGMDREATSIEFRLPRARAVARWVRSGRAARALDLRGDCLVIDTEARRASLTWRAQIPAPADPTEVVHAAVALAFGDATEDESAAWPPRLSTLGVTGSNAAALAALAAAAHARPALGQAHTLDLGELGSAPRPSHGPAMIADVMTPPLDAGFETLTSGLVFDASAAEPSWVARGTNRAATEAGAPLAPIPGAPWSPIRARSVDAVAWGDETLDPVQAERALLERPAPTPPNEATAPPLPPAPLAPARLEPARDWVPKDVPLTIGALHVAAQQAAARVSAATDGPKSAEERPRDGASLPRVAPDLDPPAERKPDRLAPVTDKAVRALAPARESPARAECLARIEKGQTLEGIALAGADLSAIDFRERSLARAILTGARLEAAVLARCNLTGALLDESDLTDANLTGAILTRADATRATLVSAKLDRAQIADALFEDANASGASFRGATGMRALFKGCSLNDATFTAASLDRADFSAAELDRTDFTGATVLRGRFEGARATALVLNGARLNDSRWEGAKLGAVEARGLAATHSAWAGAELSGANFERADLRGADLRDVDLRDADVTGANLSRANLESAILTGLRGEGVSLEGARLSGADARDIALVDARMKEASCVRTRLDGARLSSADLTRADLRHASARDAKLGRADLSQALVDGADLRGADLEGATLYKVDLGRARTAEGTRRGPSKTK
ncbi:MAG: pentapeptide repeat-containing protein [Polyangiaceae bacterium]